jgi:hypothetical protein
VKPEDAKKLLADVGRGRGPRPRYSEEEKRKRAEATSAASHRAMKALQTKYRTEYELLYRTALDEEFTDRGIGGGDPLPAAPVE